MIARYGGVTPLNSWQCLCQNGPFAAVNQSMFSEILKCLGKEGIIIQTSEGTLLLDLKGERIVNHYSFYAAFSTPEEYTLMAEGKSLGTLPFSNPISEGAFLIFAGRRWKVISVDMDKKVIDLTPSAGGRVPKFEGGAGLVDDKIKEEMHNVYTSTNTPVYLDKTAQDLLLEARKYFLSYRLAEMSILQNGKETLIFIWKGDRIINTIFVQLLARGLKVTRDGLAISVSDCTRNDSFLWSSIRH